MSTSLLLRSSRLGLLALSSAMALSLAACGGGDADVTDTLTCGEGTVEDDGRCVVAEPTACGEGTVENDEGLCVVAEPTSCGEGTTRADDGSCVPAEEACTAGTVLNAASGRCVPTADICEEGTVWSDASQRCAPEARCQPGDVILDGLCFPAAEELFRDADLTLDAEGKAGDETGVTLELVEGERQVIAGTLGAPVADADGIPRPVKPSISFDGQFGDLVYVSVHDLGLPDAAFRVIGPRGYERFSGNLGQGVNARQLFLTEAGTYTVQIIPGALSGDEERSNAYGGDDWRFVATLEHQGQAQPTALSDDQAYTIDLSQPGQNYFVVDAGVDAELIELELEHIPANYELIAYFDSELLRANPQFLLQLAAMEGSIGLSLREVFPPAGAHLPMANQLLQGGAIILDWYHRTPGSDEAQVRLNTPFSVPAGDSITREVTVKAGEIFASSFSPSMAGPLGIGVASVPAGLDMEVFDADGELIFSIEDTFGVASVDEDFPGYFFERAAADTTFTVTLTNSGEFGSDELLWRLRRQQARQLGDMIGGRLRQVAYDQFMPPGYHIFGEFSVDFAWISNVFINLGDSSPGGADLGQFFKFYDRFLNPTDRVDLQDSYGVNAAINGLPGDYLFSFTMGGSYSFGNLATMQILLVEAIALSPGESMETTYQAQDNEFIQISLQSASSSPNMNLRVTDAAGEAIYDDRLDYTTGVFFEEAGTYTLSYTLEGEETLWLLEEPWIVSMGSMPLITFTDVSGPEEVEVVTLERGDGTFIFNPNASFVAVRIDEALTLPTYRLHVATSTFGEPAMPVFRSVEMRYANLYNNYAGYVGFWEPPYQSSVLLEPGLYILQVDFNWELPDVESGELSIALSNGVE